jgi:ubiquinone/menaquinone biosynthesis C-methylase UbiE
MADWAAQSAGTPCLDVCTGTGGVARALAHRGRRVVGLDLSMGMLKHARRKARAAGVAGRAQWVRMDARRIAFRDASFPLVVCAMSLHEMGEEERRQVLGEIRRVASDRVVVADYRLPTAGWQRALFRVFRVFEPGRGFRWRHGGRPSQAARGAGSRERRGIQPCRIWRR